MRALYNASEECMSGHIEKSETPIEEANDIGIDTNSSEAASSEFKELMDSYEAFFDEYVVFMKKYKASPGDATLLKDYSNYMTKYADYMQKLNNVNSDELSTEEALYYTRVTAKIAAKLAEVAQ